MFGLFKRQKQLCTYTITVYRPEGMKASIEHEGQELGKLNSLLVRGIYAAKTMYTVSDVEFTAYTLAVIAKGCLHLQSEDDTHIAGVMGAGTVPGELMLTKRFVNFPVNVVKNPKINMPAIQTDLPPDAAVGELLTSIGVFNEGWFHEHNIQDSGDLPVEAYLQFFAGFLSYYDDDPRAFLDPQSIYQAPMKAYIMAQSNVMGIWGLIDE